MLAITVSTFCSLMSQIFKTFFVLYRPCLSPGWSTFHKATDNKFYFNKLFPTVAIISKLYMRFPTIADIEI